MGGGNESRIFSLFMETEVSLLPTVESKFYLDKKRMVKQRIL